MATSSEKISLEQVNTGLPRGLTVPKKIPLSAVQTAVQAVEADRTGYDRTLDPSIGFLKQSREAMEGLANVFFPPLGKVFNPKATLKGAGRAVAGGLRSVGEMAVSGIEALISAPKIQGKDSPLEAFSRQMESSEAANQRGRELFTKVTGLSFVPETEEDKAFQAVLELIPGGLKAIGETVYEKTGSAIAGAGSEALGVFMLLKPKAAADAWRSVGNKARGQAQSPKSDAAADTMASAFDELAAKNPAGAAEVAAHVGKGDAATGSTLAKRVEEVKGMTPEQVQELGRRLAERLQARRDKAEGVAEASPRLLEQEKGGVTGGGGKPKLLTWDQKFYGEGPKGPPPGRAGGGDKVASAQRIKGGTDDVVLSSKEQEFIKAVELHGATTRLLEGIPQKDVAKTRKLSDKIREAQLGGGPEILMAGEVGIEITPVKGGFKLSVIREGEITPLETFPTRNLAKAFAKELLQKQGVKEKLKVVRGGKATAELVPQAEGTPAQYPTLPTGKPAKTATGHEIGKVYRSKYWRKDYSVLGPSTGYEGRGVRVKWSDTGEIGEHLTHVGKDPIVGNVPAVLEAPATFAEAKKAVDTTALPAQDALANATSDITKAVEAPDPKNQPGPGMDDPGYTDLNMGIPIKLSDLKTAFDFSRKYIPGVELAVGKTAEYWDATQRAFAPESRSPEAKRAGAVIASRVAQQNLSEAMTSGPPSARRLSFWNMHPDLVSQFIQGFEKGAKFADPILAKAADGYRQWNFDIFKTERELGIVYEPFENYLYHVFEDGPGVQAFFDRRSGIKWGQPGFIRDRVFDLYEEAAKAGFKPRFANPEDIMLARQHAHDVARAKVDIIRELNTYGLARRVRKGETSPPEGFAPAPRRSPTGEHYWIHNQAEAILHNLYDTKSLWTMGKDAGANVWEKGLGTTFRGAMFLKNSVVPVILSASGFHGLHVLTIDNIPAAIRATKEWAAGAEKASSAIGRVAKAFVYADLAKNPRIGGRINNIIRGKIPESEWTYQDKLSLQMMMEGGFVPLQPHVYKTAADRNVRGAIEKAIGLKRTGKLGQAAVEATKAVFHAPFAAIQLLQRPMFDIWIPNIKAAAYLKDVAAAIKSDPTLMNDVGRRKEVFRRLAKSVDNRYGEMAYNTLFWDKWVKDIGVAVSLSLGWNLGFIREYGGAAIDAGVSGARGGGKGPTFRQRIGQGDYDKALFITMYSAQALMYGGLITYLMTGDPPDELLDYTHPKIGEKNPDGSEMRVNTMFYPREFVSIAKHIEQAGVLPGMWHLLASKAAPTIGMVQAATTGVDSLGREIRDPEGSPYRRLQQTLLHMLYEMEPISVDAIQREMSQDKRKSIGLAIAGFAPAAQYITATPTEAKIRSQFLKYHGKKQVPYEEALYSEEARRLKRHFQLNRPREYVELLDEMEKKFELSPGEIRRLERSIESDVDPLHRMFSRLGWRMQRDLMDKMTPEELEIYQPLSNKEHLRYDYVPPRLR